MALGSDVAKWLLMIRQVLETYLMSEKGETMRQRHAKLEIVWQLQQIRDNIIKIHTNLVNLSKSR